MIRRDCSAGGIVIYRGLILILRNRQGQWVFPKGGMEPGESVEDAALREVWEETGLKAVMLEKAGETRYTFYSKEERCEKIVHWFLMNVEDPDLTLCRREGFIEAVFAPFRDAQALLTHDNDRWLMENITMEK